MTKVRNHVFCKSLYAFLINLTRRRQHEVFDTGGGQKHLAGFSVADFGPPLCFALLELLISSNFVAAQQEDQRAWRVSKSNSRSIFSRRS